MPAVCIGLALTQSACGKKGPPRPPAPRGPLPPGSVEARQLGDRVEASFGAPEPRGPKPAQTPVRAELVRVEYPPSQEPPPGPEAFRRRGNVVALREADPLPPAERLSLVDPTWTELTGGGVGWTLRYGVRVLDRRGRPSPLVVAPDLVPMSVPEPPSDLRAEATGDGVRLTWTLPPWEAKVLSNLYRTEPGQVFGERPVHAAPLTSPEYLDTTVEIGRTYRYAVRATLSEDPPFRESASSRVVEVLAEDRVPPAAPTGLVAIQEGAGVRLFWNPSREKDLSGYRVYRRVGDSPWRRIGPDPVAEPLFLDDDVEAGLRVTYRLTAVDRAAPPNESAPSEEADLEIAPEEGAGGSGP